LPQTIVFDLLHKRLCYHHNFNIMPKRKNQSSSASASKPATRARKSTRNSTGTKQRAAQRSTRSIGRRESTPTPPSHLVMMNRAEMKRWTRLLCLTVFKKTSQAFVTGLSRKWSSTNKKMEFKQQVLVRLSFLTHTMQRVHAKSRNSWNS
jgi:hypothetical protein